MNPAAFANRACLVLLALVPLPACPGGPGGGDLGPAPGPGDLAARGPDPGQPGPRRTAGFDLEVPLGAPAGAAQSITVVGPSEDGATLSTIGAPFPLVLLSPGFTVPRGQYRGYADRLASFGFVAVLQTPRAEFDHARYRDDTVAALGWLIHPSGPDAGRVAGRIDPGRIGLGGHSLGGQISTLVAAQDPRVKALFLIDPVDGGAPPALGVIAGIHLPGGLPLALVGETVSEGGAMPCAPAGRNYQALYAAASAPALAITVLGAAHPDFVDDYAACLTCALCQPPGTAPRARTHDLAVKYLAAYFLWGLGGDPGARDDLLGSAFAGDVAAGLVTGTAK